MQLEEEKKPFGLISTELRKNITIRTVLGFTLSGVLLWLTFHSSGLKWQSLGLKNEQWFFFAAAILSFMLATWIQSVRTKLIWQGENLSFKEMRTYAALLIGNFYNCLLPGNLGEGVRALYFSKVHKVRFTLSLSVVFTEKWIDAQIFIFLTIGLLALKPFVSHYILYAIINTALVVIILSVVYYLVRKYRWMERMIWLPVLSFKKTGLFFFRMYWYISYQLKYLRRSGAIVFLVMLSTFTFMLNVLQFWLVMKAAGVTEPVSGLYTAYLIAASMMIIAFIPAAPSNLGVLHYGIYSAMILAAKQYQIQPDSSCLQSYALFAVYLHLSLFIPEVVLGLFCVVKERKILFG